MKSQDPLRWRFLDALRRRRSGYVPLDISLCPGQLRRFEEKYGHRDVAREWNFPHRGVQAPFTPATDTFSRWHPVPDGKTRIDEWGIGHRPSDDGSHFEQLIHPLAAVTSVEEIRDYPFPRPAGEEHRPYLCDQVTALYKAGLASIGNVTPVGGTIFWPAYKLRGMEPLLCDMLTNPAMAECLLDRVTEICVRHARIMAQAGVDVLFLADDLGTQTSTYMSPGMFRDWIKPKLAEVIAAARGIHPDILVLFHSDGAVQSFIPDFIEIGIDILNPIQPECMDPGEVKRRFGDRLSLSGCIGMQTTMPFGSSDDVRVAVTRCCETLGANGGLWIAPSHVIEPEVPWENVMAFVETARRHGTG